MIGRSTVLKFSEEPARIKTAANRFSGPLTQCSSSWPSCWLVRVGVIPEKRSSPSKTNNTSRPVARDKELIFLIFSESRSTLLSTDSTQYKALHSFLCRIRFIRNNKWDVGCAFFFSLDTTQVQYRTAHDSVLMPTYKNFLLFHSQFLLCCLC
jgi:hypothetical protein